MSISTEKMNNKRSKEGAEQIIKKIRIYLRMRQIQDFTVNHNNRFELVISHAGFTLKCTNFKTAYDDAINFIEEYK